MFSVPQSIPVECLVSHFKLTIKATFGVPASVLGRQVVMLVSLIQVTLDQLVRNRLLWLPTGRD